MADVTVPAVDVVVVGSGFGGIAVVRALREQGVHDVVVLERADSVGGTWRDNTYPGCACDVPSHLYSFSFAPNPDWSRLFSPQPEIESYLRRVADDLGVTASIRFGCALEAARWDDAAARWRLTTTDGDLSCRVLVLATGGLSEPAVPDLPGLDRFAGPVMHTARWDHGVDLAGRAVAVVGTGASAIQVVPALQPVAARIDLYQRTPAWILPRRDRAVAEWERRLFRAVPAAQRAVRGGQFWRRELTTSAFTTRPALMDLARRTALAHLARQVPDPVLRDLLTPRYAMGCKRILLSDDFYPAVASDTVDLVPHAVTAVSPTGLVAADGRERAADALVFATGFHVTDPPVAGRIRDSAGRPLAEHLGRHPAAYKATAFPGFPNLFLVTGPNAGLANNSMVVMIEAHARYIADAVAGMQRHGVDALEVRREAVARWDAAVQAASEGTVWSSGGCRSWYLDATGRNAALWPWGTRRFEAATRRFDPGAYRLRRPADQTGSADQTSSATGSPAAARTSA